jgi:hypothetical protein
MSNTRKCVVWRVRTVEVLEAFEVDAHENDLVIRKNSIPTIWNRGPILDSIPDDTRPVLVEVRDRSRQCDGIVVGGIQDAPFQNILSEKYLYSEPLAARKAIECATETVTLRPRLWGDYYDFE